MSTDGALLQGRVIALTHSFLSWDECNYLKIKNLSAFVVHIVRDGDYDDRSMGK